MKVSQGFHKNALFYQICGTPVFSSKTPINTKKNHHNQTSQHPHPAPPNKPKTQTSSISVGLD